MNEEKLITADDVDHAFRAGEVYDASNDVLRKYLQVLNTQGIPNDRVRHRATNRCTTINTIINMRFIESVERLNTRLTVIVIALTIMTILIGTCTLVATVANILVTFNKGI
jgi:hypothetical protein